MVRKRAKPPAATAGSGGAPNAAETIAAGGNGGGARMATPGGAVGRAGSTIEMVYGTRPVKGYPITEGELGQLFGIGILATICFSLAAALFGFAVDVTKELAFAPETSEAVVSWWSAATTFSWFLSVILFLAGIIFLVRGNNVLSNIKKTTIFPGHDGTR